MLDFDHAVLDFWEWFEAKQEEQVPGADTGPKLRKGQSWVRKYRSFEEIFSRYGNTDTKPMPSVSELRQKAANDEAMIMDFWSDDE